MHIWKRLRLLALVVLLHIPAKAHEGDHSHADHPATVSLPLVPENKGPVKIKPDSQQHSLISGQGYWKFVPVKGAVPVPDNARDKVKGAHGTVVYDADRDIVYWGLQSVGWIGFSNKLQASWIIKGDEVFSRGNLHGADLLPRKGKLPLIAVADDSEGEVYLSDTTFAKAQVLPWPGGQPYQSKGEFHPTDVAFIDQHEIYITDGYGKAFFVSSSTEPFAYKGEFLGGKDMSQTPHGITYKKDDKMLLIAARPEAQAKRYKIKNKQWLETFGLPQGSTVCDLDVWGDYALAPCLDGPGKSPGPIYILNLKKKTIASIIKPKDELGYGDALHIHDAAWYFSGKGNNQEVYIIFTNWNPGGIGALKLVNQKD
ncbi:MAG: hypothetical protein SFY81_08610 [Verrucomicrobiota bacterium]|nr:hypothetical protein [Verrucomicrobiota bacterium]